MAVMFAGSGRGRGRPAPAAPAVEGGGSGLLGGRDVEGQLDLVGDEHVAAAEGLVELHAVLAAAELAGELQADLLVAVGVDVDAVDLGGEDELVGDAVQREVADDAVGVLVDGLDAGGLEGEVLVGVGVEEVGRAQVRVALGLVGVDRGGLDGAVGLAEESSPLEPRLEPEPSASGGT
jgi:hypothetical protein